MKLSPSLSTRSFWLPESCLPVFVFFVTVNLPSQTCKFTCAPLLIHTSSMKSQLIGKPLINGEMKPVKKRGTVFLRTTVKKRRVPESPLPVFYRKIATFF